MQLHPQQGARLPESHRLLQCLQFILPGTVGAWCCHIEKSPNDSLKKRRLITQNYIWLVVLTCQIYEERIVLNHCHITDHMYGIVWYMFYLCAECIFFHLGFNSNPTLSSCIDADGTLILYQTWMVCVCLERTKIEPPENPAGYWASS